jgi:hypothetical protein
MKREIIKQNADIDIAKDDFKVCFSVMTPELDVVIKGSTTFANTPKGFEAFNEWVKRKRIVELDLHFTMEATGVYYESPAYIFTNSLKPYTWFCPIRQRNTVKVWGSNPKRTK